MTKLIDKFIYYVLDHTPKDMILNYVHECYYDDLHEYEPDHEDYSQDLD